MRALSRILAPIVLVLSQRISHAEERERILCDPGNPDTQCPGESCRCIDDTLEVTFEGKEESILTVAPPDVDSRIAVIVVSETKSTVIQGWSYGVRHDARFLTMNLATMEDTDAKAAFRGGFEVTTADGVEECEEVAAGLGCASPRPGGGWIQGVVLSFGEAVELPVKRNSLARAEYTLKELPPDAGTLIAVTERLRRSSSPPVQINLTRMGQSRRPRHVVDGWIRGSGGPPPELCANALDDDGDGSTDCEDDDCLGSVACGPPLEICGNGKDDDRDGVQDCLDAECVDAKVPCTEVCGNREDDDTDGKVDCFDDDCDGNSFCVPRDEECNNVWDDDRDGDTDCKDSDCFGKPACLEVCGNDRDDDLDGKADCQDDDCRGNAVCVEDCENGHDDDFDGKSDCADEECAGITGCQEICGNRRDDDRDGRFDCYDEDCAAEEACAPKQEICNNREDEDFDFLTDCEDPECKDEVWCNPRDEICGNRWDDDFDRKIDCGDEDCAGDTICKEAPEEDCDNARDDDLDLRVDCADDDCGPSAPNCSAARENCGNAADDDGDGRTDCNDEDCSVDAACQGAGEGGFIRGDVDGNMRLNVIDAILSVPVGELPGRRDCSDAQDADDDGRLTVLDTVTLLTYLFQRGPDLATPGVRCGVDGTGDTLGCTETACP